MRKRIRDMTLAEFEATYPPIAGGSPDDPPPPAADPPAADPPAAPEPPPPPAADPPRPDENVTVPKAELDALKRRVAENEKAQRQAAREARETEEARQREQGEFKELAESKAREAEENRAELEGLRRELRVERIAKKLRFRDPADVRGRLTAEEADDDTLAENALEKIAAASPHLIDTPAAVRPEIGRVLDPSAQLPGTPGSPVKNAEHYEAMSQKDLANLPDEEFKTALKMLKAAGKL